MLPLDGIKVIAIEQAVAAPLASRHLADFGARVIKIERPGSGDFARGYDTAVRGMSSWFVWLNRSKESLTLDLKHAEAKTIVNRLIAESDVLVHNLAPGAAERLGLGGEALVEKHPRLIVCEISGYGAGGPYRDKKAYDLLIQNETGLVSITGTPEAPAKTGISSADIAAGVYAFSGVLLALRKRDQTGRGSVLRVSLFDALSEWMMPAGYFAAYSGQPPRPSGAEHASIAPYGSYCCGDGNQINLAIQNEREWTRFCSVVLQRPDVASDARFCRNPLRSDNRAALRIVIEDVFAALTMEQVVERLDAAEIASAHRKTVQQFWEHPQHSARQRWREIESPVGTLAALQPPIVLEGEEARMGGVPALGEHTDAILSSLGYTAEQIARLRSGAVI
jgi:itaconate CoA-transferase